ncbi:type II secretion system protein [Campylobacter fetus]|uniref:type II secretion system protein n=1 Tax=Campylobacter fetus TaxID=196 RepID=UPI000818AD67|nr:prepilin-type N-terminal cleavage/methylation domain-containing protein [Campylobacter fetus]
MKRKSIISLSRGFTMIEIVFVIVILGIFASLAVPRLLVTKQDLEISKIRSQIASVRAGIENYAISKKLAGESKIYPRSLDLSDADYSGSFKKRSADNFELFTIVLPKSGIRTLPYSLPKNPQGWYSNFLNYYTRYRIYIKGYNGFIIMDYCGGNDDSGGKCKNKVGQFICTGGRCELIGEKTY